MRSSRIFAALPVASRTEKVARRFALLSCGALTCGGFLLTSSAARAVEKPDAAVRAARLLLAQLPAVVRSDAENGPVVSVLQPSYSDVLRGDTAIVIGIQARRYPASTIELLVDGKSASNGAMKIGDGASLSFNWKTSDFADGSHRLTVRVTDTQGFRSDAEVRVYINNGKTADVTPPTLSWMNVRSGDLLRGDKQLQLQASDNFGVKYVWVSIKSTLDPTRPLKMWMVNRAPFNFTLNSTRLPDGLYTLEALAWDALENEGHADQVTFGIANNAINPTWMSQLDAARTAAKSDAFAAPVKSTTPRAATEAKASRIVVPSAKSAASTRTARIAEGVTAPATPEDLGSAATTGVFAELDSAPSQLDRTSRTVSQSRELLASMPPEMRRASTRKAAPLSIESAQPSIVALQDAAASTRSSVAKSAELERIAAAPRVSEMAFPDARRPVVQSDVKATPVTSGVSGLSVITSRQRDRSVARQASSRTSVATTHAASVKHVATAPRASVATSQVAKGKSVAAPKADTGVARPSMPRVAAIPDFKKQQQNDGRAASITVMPQGRAIPAFHNAKAGETMDEIAARYGVSKQLLMAVNPDANARVLAAGMKLRLPRLLQVRFAGKPVAADVSSMMVGSTGVTPFRFLFEKQGGTMTWDSANQRVLARTADQEVTVTIGSKEAVVNRQQVTMDLAAFLLSGRTMVPVRFFEKALHAQIEWEPSTGRLFVAMNNDAPKKAAPKG